MSTTEAIFGFVDMKLHIPSDVEVGATNVYVLCVIEIDCGANTPSTGVPGLTRICVDLDRAVKAPVAACAAVIVEVPAPTTLIVLPEIVATFVFDEVNDHGAGELVVGGTIATEPTPYAAVMIGNGPRMVKVACAGAVEAKRDTTRATVV